MEDNTPARHPVKGLMVSIRPCSGMSYRVVGD